MENMSSQPLSGDIHITVLLIDTQPIFRAGLHLLIETDQEIKVVGEAANIREAINLAELKKPNVILLDLIMGKENGLDYIPRLMRVSKNSRILILTSIQNPEVHHDAVRLGAIGLVTKESSPETLLMAIKKVHQGEAWLNRAMVGKLLTGLAGHEKQEEKTATSIQINNLTKREREIIKFVAMGKKNKQIAESLALSEITVRHHLTSVFDKLGVADRFELMIYAYKHGLSDLPKP
jgi:DNA-binding NarL/FixJ family response regulator